MAAVAASVLALGVGAVVGSGPATAAPRPATTFGCDTVPIFETDGYINTDTGVSWDAFNAHVPAGYTAQKILYWDGVAPVIDPYPLDDAVADGVAELGAAVQSYHAACPTSRMILAGYSEGAAVAGNVIEDLAASTSVPHALIDGVLYGDPRRPFGDGGAAGKAGGIETNLPSFLPGVTMQGPHEFGDIAVHEVCNENDGICNSQNMITDPTAFANGLAGYSSGAHTSYAFDPVADQGSGLTLAAQKPIIHYTTPLLPGVGTPWQVQQSLGGPAILGQLEELLHHTLSLIPGPPSPLLGVLGKLPFGQQVMQGAAGAGT